MIRGLSAAVLAMGLMAGGAAQASTMTQLEMAGGDISGSTATDGAGSGQLTFAQFDRKGFVLTGADLQFVFTVDLNTSGVEDKDKVTFDFTFANDLLGDSPFSDDPVTVTIGEIDDSLIFANNFGGIRVQAGEGLSAFAGSGDIAFDYTVSVFRDETGLSAGYDVRFSNVTYTFAPIPLPAGVWLMLGALGAMGGIAARRRRIGA